MGNYFSYMRISTKAEREKQTFARQEDSLTNYSLNQGIRYIIEFKEDASGKNFKDRPEWNKLESIVQNEDTIVFKDVSRFTREAENGYSKYMELFNKGVNLVFLDNPTISTSYIKELLGVATRENLIAKTSIEATVKLLLIVELDRAEQERLTFIKRIKDGIAASDKKSGRPKGKLDKMTDELQADISMYLNDRSIKMVDLMDKHGISRNTLKKYIELVKENKA